MKNVVHGTTMVNLKNRIDVKLANNEKHCLKWTSKPNCMSQKVSDNISVVIRRGKVTLTLNKPTCAC